MSGEPIESIINKHSWRLMSLPGVMGVAEGEYDLKPCIKVYIARENDELKSRIPANIEGYTVIVEVSGGFQALGT